MCTQSVRKVDYSPSNARGRPRNPMDDLRREVTIMKRLRHLNIVELYEVIDDPMVRVSLLAPALLHPPHHTWPVAVACPTTQLACPSCLQAETT